MYPSERVEKLPADYVQRFFLEGVGRNAGHIKVREEARRQIVFRQLNLLDASWPIRAPIQAIFCRNVMIYFDKDTQRSILGRFASLLEPGGLLFAGHSENFTQTGDLFRSLGRTVYSRVDSGASASSQVYSPRSTNG